MTLACHLLNQLCFNLHNACCIHTKDTVGLHHFVLDEVEGNGSPSQLTIAFPDGAPRITVPEPATLALLGIGLAGIGFGRRRMQE